MTATGLAGQVAVVTGASSGIGASIAEHLAQAGCHVVVTARRSLAGAQATAGRVRDCGVDCLVLPIDLVEHDRLEAFVERAFSWKGHCDVWVNNAGVDTLTGEGRHWCFEEKLARLLRVDVSGTLLLSRSVGRRMRAAGGGAIVNLGWDQAATGMAGDSGELFATAKGAVMAMTRSLALSLAPEVRVNCVAPGWIQTAWGADASDSWQRRAIQESALARWGRPEDVARVCRFLVSPEAGFVTGQIVNVNGGFRASAPET